MLYYVSCNSYVLTVTSALENLLVTTTTTTMMMMMMMTLRHLETELFYQSYNKN